MAIGALGKQYGDGESIIREGEPGDCMYVVQEGSVEVVKATAEGEAVLAVLEPGDVFGEMSLFTRAARSSSVRARGGARVLTVDKRGFMRRIHEDPSLAFRILQKMSERIERLNQEVVRLEGR
jgi:CRP-like cAMP-binding protein